MIFLILCASFCIYCSYNYQQDVFDHYLIGSIVSGAATAVMLLTAFANGFESSAEFETYKEVRANLEYQIAHPASRDDNFFEQLSNYNTTIVKNQEYNKDWFLNDIYISDKWNTIEPIDYSEAN